MAIKTTNVEGPSGLQDDPGNLLGRPQSVQLFAAGIVFALGVAVYLLDRPGSGVYFVPSWWTLADITPSFFGILGQSLPTFTHIFVFTLLTTAVVAPGAVGSMVICVAWLVIDLLFELAQIDTIALAIASQLPTWFYDWPLLDNTANYFLAGRFDPLDILSITLGSATAGLILLISTRYEEKEC